MSIIIDKGLRIIEEIETTREIIEKIKVSKNFTYKVKVKKFKQIDLKPGIHQTTCITCNRTFHKNSSFSDNADKKRFCAIDIINKFIDCFDICYKIFCKK